MVVKIIESNRYLFNMLVQVCQNLQSKMQTKSVQYMAQHVSDKQKRLEIWENGLCDDQIKFLCAQDTSHSLSLQCKTKDASFNGHIQSLFAHGNKITSEGLLNFRMADWSSLKELYLGNNLIDGKGCKYLARGAVPHLQKLFLNSNRIGSEGVMHLSKGQWSKLEVLYLASTGLSVGSIKWVISGNYRNIKSLNLNYNQLQLTEILGVLLNQFQKLKTTLLRQQKNDL